MKIYNLALLILIIMISNLSFGQMSECDKFLLKAINSEIKILNEKGNIKKGFSVVIEKNKLSAIIRIYPPNNQSIDNKRLYSNKPYVYEYQFNKKKLLNENKEKIKIDKDWVDIINEKCKEL